MTNKPIRVIIKQKSDKMKFQNENRSIVLMMKKKIEVLLAANDMNVVDLAKCLGTSSQNLYNKLSRDNFKVKDLEDIAEATESELEIRFITKDGMKI